MTASVAHTRPASVAHTSAAAPHHYTTLGLDNRKVAVRLTKDQIKNAPEFDESRFHDRAHRDEVGSYYGLNRPAGPDFGKSDSF